MAKEVSWRVKAQRFGGKLSAMVLPNLGAFMGWGILTALGIWLSNDMLKGFISPMLTYLLPMLIGVAGGKLVYGDKGAVIGAFTTMGVVVGSDITMLLGAMIIAPLAAWVLKKVDAVIEPHIPIGFELLFGKGRAKANAYGATVIHAIGGIHEIYFPFILMNPVMAVAAIAGGITGTFLFSLFGVGLVGVSSPGSVITIMMMAAAGDQLMILLAILASAAVSFVVASVIVKNTKQDEEEGDRSLREAAKQMEALKGKKSRISSVFEDKEEAFDYGRVKKILYVCDAGLGSSAMGASVISKKLKKAGITDVEVRHASVMELPQEAEVIVTHTALREVVKGKQPDTMLITIQDYLNAPEYEELVTNISKARS